MRDHFAIGTDVGQILKVSKYGHLKYPKIYKSKFIMPGHWVTCLDYHPYSSEFILSGYDSGQVMIYGPQSETPLNIWNISDHSILSVQWSRHRLDIFFVMDAIGELTIWDLTQPWIPLRKDHMWKLGAPLQLSDFGYFKSKFNDVLKVSSLTNWGPWKLSSLLALLSQDGKVQIELLSPELSTSDFTLDDLRALYTISR